MKRWYLFSILFTGILLLVAGCSSGVQTTNSKGIIKIVAAENFYGEVAEQVGGDKVKVQSILSDSVMDPEDYEATPENAKDIYAAQIVVYNGLGYDAWMEKLLSASPKGDRKVIAVATDVLGLKQGDNPHVWYDLTIMPKLASALAEQLAIMDVQNADFYRKNAETYVKSLQPLLQKADSLVQKTPVPIEISETIFDYMGKKLNLIPQTPNFARAIFNGVDPSPADIIQIQKNLQEKKVRLLIYNSRTKNPTVDQLVTLAKSSGVPVVSVTEQKPADKTYLTWMLDQLTELEGVLNGK